VAVLVAHEPPGMNLLADGAGWRVAFPEMQEGMARIQANSGFFLAHLLPTTIHHAPDVARLREVASRIVVGVEAASQGQMPHLVALALATDAGLFLQYSAKPGALPWELHADAMIQLLDPPSRPTSEPATTNLKP
jgi:hypothetical protein